MLSVIIICCDEESNISECLESVRFADEIVVVDSGSTDQTLSICRTYTPLIYHQEWLGMNRQKESALDKATGDWILNIDADERIAPALTQEILEAIGTAAPDLAGYHILRKAFYLGKWLRYGGWTPDFKLRLFRRGQGHWVGTDPHDRVEVSGKTAFLKEPMLHLSFRDLKEHSASNNTYSSIAAREMHLQKKKSNWGLILLHSWLAFMKSFFLKKGFLEGTRGLIQAIMITHGVALKYTKLWELNLDSTPGLTKNSEDCGHSKKT